MRVKAEAGVQGAEPLGGGLGANPHEADAFFCGLNRDKSPYRVRISLSNLTTKKLILKVLMHKTNIFSYISPSFIGAGAPCPHPIVNEALYKH